MRIRIFDMLPGKIALTALRIAESERITPREALGRFYASTTYRSLEDESTKCWWESPHELHRDYDTRKNNPSEANSGCLKFPNGIHRTDDLIRNTRGC